MVASRDRKPTDNWSYDSKKETGFVGLKKQGATDYMNSLLQTLYYIPYFRKAIYHIPTTENDMPSGSIPLALQSLFYKLQYSDNSVATKELTKSFGWDTDDSFMQHDVQELNRVLCEKLEDKMKGTVVEGTIQYLFEGHYKNYIECINVNYKSTRKESFYDLQLDVKGCQDVYASFDKYVKVERLEGDNKYQAGNLGLQDAEKGVRFIDFPPVLQLHLKRFEYDIVRDTSVKINDRYEFPLQLDLDKYLSPGADRTVRNVYTLHSVLVHNGMVLGGHYYAFIRPTPSHQWFKFDNEKVTKEDTKKALEEHYGGGEELPQTNPGSNNTPFKFTKYSNAYMLVYIRESDKEKIMCDVDEKDIAEHLRIRLKKEQEEKEHKKKEKAEAQLYTIIKVARNEDLMEQIGKKIIFDLVDHDKVRAFRIENQLSFNHFKEEVFKEFGIPVRFQRFWLWAKRQNHTYRPNRPLTPQEETQSVGQLRKISNNTHNAELKLFLEVEIGPDRHFLPLPPKMKEEILLFFKLYDPEKEDLKFVGKLSVKSLGKPTEILSKLTEMAKFPPNEEIDLYEEINFEPNVMCEHIDKLISFRSSQLEDGDIICYQKSLTSANRNQFRYPDVPSFLEYVHNCQNMDTNLVAVTKRLRLTDVDPSSSSVVRSSRNLQPDSSLRNWNSRNLKPEERERYCLYEENKSSVVWVSNLGARRDFSTMRVLEVPQGHGSGFIWDRRGHIITNYHVIHNAFNLRVTLADQAGTYEAKVVGYDQDNDVAVLRIGAPWEKLWPIKVGRSTDLCVGLDVFAIGHPFRLRDICIPGVISGLGVDFTTSANRMPIRDGILTNALVNPGNSGGPLLDSSGYLIGIVTAIHSKIGESCGIAYAVPVDTVKRVVERFVLSWQSDETYIG